MEHFKKNRTNYQLVITDWRLSNLNGLELLKKLKKLNSNVTTILISAYEVENEPIFKKIIGGGNLFRHSTYSKKIDLSNPFKFIIRLYSHK